MSYLLRFLKLAGLLFFAGLVVLFFQFNVFALQFVDSVSPGSGWIAFLALTVVEIAGFVLLALAWMPKSSRLVLKNDPTPAEREAFHSELMARLASNPHVKAAGLSPSAPDFADRAMAALDEHADRIVRQDARKIFLGTALAQNGRMDALVVFVALARMVWRISTTYNQRPTPAEILSVYSTVSTNAFVAFTIDALDIPRTVTEALGNLVPAVGPHMAGTTLPFLGSTMHLFTSSMLDGAANGLLAIRAGILTKNAFRYSALEKDEARALSAKEIRSTMLSLSRECITDITVGLKNQVKDMAESVADNCVEKTVGAAKAVAGAAGTAVETTVGAAKTVAEAAGTAVETTVGAARAVAGAAGSAVETTVEAAKTVAGVAGSAVETTVGVVGSTADFAQHTVRSAGHAAGDLLNHGRDTARKLVHGAGSLVGSLVPGRRRKRDVGDRSL